MNFHQYGEFKIPVMEGTNPNPFYNMPQDEIDRLSTGTLFTDDAENSCMQPGGFRGTPFDETDIPRLDDQECKERCEFLKRNRASIIHLMSDNKVPVKYQNGLGYCWAYGSTSVIEANMLVQGMDYVELSPESCAAPIKRGRNQGGWASEFMEYAEEHGVAKQSTWAPHDTNYRKYETPEVNAERMNFKPLEWIDIAPRDMQATRSLLAANFAQGNGLNWWRHLLCFAILDWSNEFGWLYGERNSHGAKFGLDGWCFHTENSARHSGGSTVRVAA